VALALAGCASSEPGERGRDPLDLTPSRERIERDVRRLAAFGTRHTLSVTDDDERGIGAARRWLLAELEAIAARHHGGRLRCALVPHQVEPTERVPEGALVVNVVGVLPGRDPDRLVVVSGHYDSRASDPLDATSDAPGAGDDASGTAVVLECARLLAGLEPRATVVFLCVAGEEQGLLGARAQAEAWRDQGLHVEAFVTNDIVGGARGSNGRLEPWRLRVFSEGRPSVGEVVGSDNDAPSRQLARYLEELGEAAVPGLDVELVFRQDRFLRGGDHRPFNQLGFAGVRFTEPNENYAWQHQDVRVEDGVAYGDLPEHCDFDYVARVATVNAAGIRALALAPRHPEGVRMDTSELSPDTRLSWDDDPRAAGWRVRMRRTWQPTWTEAVDVGRATEVTLEGWSKDDWIFAVEARDAAGNASLPVAPTP
jgi:acetylornithine deacetylase/succinyl-diaminopimelate desuccinylase-like protein